MTFSLFDLLIIIGITQGVIAFLLLLCNRDRSQSDLFLALAILSFCLLFVKILMNYNGLLATARFRYLPNAFELSTAPLFYFYLLALTEKDFTWRPVYWLHFLPLMLAQSYALLLFLNVFDLETIQAKDLVAIQFHYVAIKEIEDWLIVLSILSYLYLGYQKYVQFQQQVKNNTADSAYPTLHWLRTILRLSGVLIAWLLINMGLSRSNWLASGVDLHWKIYFIYQATITYYLGFMAYRQQKPDLNQIYPNNTNQKTNKVNTEKALVLTQKLKQLLEDRKIYLNPNLNIIQVADKLTVSPSTLSQVINDQLQKSFRELINEYRIEDFKTKLIDPENNASILSLALESGFNSEASFYRIFKNSTGQTPKAFIKKCKNQNEI